MIKNNLKSFKSFILIFMVSLVVFYFLGSIISNLKGFNFRDVIFVEGIIVLMGVIFSSIDGSPQGLTLQEFGQINPQYFANIILETKVREGKGLIEISNVKINIDLISMAIVLGATITLISSFII